MLQFYFIVLMFHMLLEITKQSLLIYKLSYPLTSFLLKRFIKTFFTNAQDLTKVDVYLLSMLYILQISIRLMVVDVHLSSINYNSLKNFTKAYEMFTVTNLNMMLIA